MKASVQLSNLRRNLVIDYGIKEEYVLEFVELYDKFTELESKILNEGIVKRANPKICPVCESNKTYLTVAIHCNNCAVTTEI